MELKPRLRGTSPGVAGKTVGIKRLKEDHHHLVIQIARPLLSEEVQSIQAADGRIVQYLPRSGYVVSTHDESGIRELLASMSAAVAVHLTASDKLSPDLDQIGTGSDVSFAVIEFYSDVDMDEARAIVLQSQLQIQENPDLTRNDLLVSGSHAAIAALASWDEVAYIFPASQDLIQGVPVNACPGAISVQGMIGQIVAKVGSWSGADNAQLYYTFGTMSDKVPADEVKAEVARAFAEWAKYAKISFTPGSDPRGNSTVAVKFASGDHGDGYPFTSCAVLAHTFYPAPVNPEPIAGDMHLNLDENWQIGADVDVFSVALHETGHALGLGHSDQPGAVMYPYYRKSTGLTQEDISAIQTLYAAPDAAPAPPTTPLIFSVNDFGSSNTMDSTLSLSGTDTGGSGTGVVTWRSSWGGSGSAVGWLNWTIVAVPLSLGSNAITLTATDTNQSSAAKTLTIVRQAPIAPTTPGAMPPVIQITLPTMSSSYTAPSATVMISGTASDSSGILNVTWSNSAGHSAQAIGTTIWSTGTVPLSAGSTVYAITAHAFSGMTATQTLTVTYSPPAPAPPTAAPPTEPGNTPTSNPPATNPGSGDPGSGNPSPGTAAPSLVIVSPASTSVGTSQSTMAFSGTAQGSVTTVTWSTSNGDTGTAAGTTNWSIPTIPLLVGANTVTIRPSNASGQTAWRSVVVTRR